MSTVEDDGATYIASLASYIRSHSERLASSSSKNGQASTAASSWTSSLLLTSNPLKPLTLTLSLYHLYYVLLKIQEAGFADVGDIDVPLSVDRNRRPAGYGHTKDPSDARSTQSSWTFASSMGSGWWGASSSSSANPQVSLERNLKIIYTAFTLLPALRIVMKDDTKGSSSFKGKNREIDGFAKSDYPGDRMVPLKAFKSLQRLEVQDVDFRVLLFYGEWSNLRVLQVRNAGIEDMSDLLLEPDGDRRKWPPLLRVLDLEQNDVTNLDAEDLEGLERLHSLSLRRNLLVSVPTALSGLISLRSLDLSENMVDSVLAIYKSLGALSILNLRSNRISSLCGLERLLSLEVLDMRSNLVFDFSEFTRLVTLPHIREVYVSPGNPFLEDEGTPSATTSSNGWRIDLFNAFLAEANEGNGRSKDYLPSIDGFPASWNEKRYFVEAPKGGSGFVRQASSFETPSNGDSRSQAGVASPARTQYANSPRIVRTRQPSEMSTRSARVARLRQTSPPPPLPSLPTTPGLPSPDIQSDAESVKSPVKPKMVKRRQRRIVNLDGETKEAADGSGGRARHERSVSSPGGSVTKNGRASNGDAEDSVERQHHTISTPSKNRRTSSRRLTEDTFAPGPAKDTNGKASSDNKESGSEAEEFRKRMERLRDEVGVENWLSVYANTSATNSRSATPASAQQAQASSQTSIKAAVQ